MPTDLLLRLGRCAWVAAGICHSQVRHFEGIFNLASAASPPIIFLRLRRACEQRLMPA